MNGTNTFPLAVRTDSAEPIIFIMPLTCQHSRMPSEHTINTPRHQTPGASAPPTLTDAVDAILVEFHQVRAVALEAALRV